MHFDIFHLKEVVRLLLLNSQCFILLLCTFLPIICLDTSLFLSNNKLVESMRYGIVDVLVDLNQHFLIFIKHFCCHFLLNIALKDDLEIQNLK